MRKFLLFMLLCSSIGAFAQSAASNTRWCFGYHYGLSFSAPGVPTQFTNQMNTIEGCASICDNSGNLLFYSSGEEVRDRLDNLMPNGSGILGNGPAGGGLGPGSSCQGVAIVPSVSNLNQYYLFVLDACEQMPQYGGKLRYSVIDMTLNGGMGDVVSGQKNIQIGDSLGEKMCVALGVDCNYWVIVHNIDSGQYEAFRVDGSGIATNPVRSNTGVCVASGGGTWAYACGEMKLSPDETMIAQVNTVSIQIELAYFDKTTGIVSGAVKIDSLPYVRYGCSFSPNSQVLYVSTWGGLYQYNLALLPNISSIISSKVTVNNSYNSGLRIGNDNKIYVASQQTANVGCINSPNTVGMGCNLTYPITLPATIYLLYPAGLGLATVVLPQDTTIVITDTAICTPNNFQVSAPAGYSSYLWSDGTTQQTNNFNAAGTKWVIAHVNCTTLIDTFHVTTPPSDSSYGSFDTTVCLYAPDSIVVNAPAGYTSYLWNDGSTQATHSFTTPGVKWVYAKLLCHIFVDTFKVLQAPQDTTFSRYDTTVCFKPQLVLQGTPGYNKYLWSNGDTTFADTITTSGYVWVTGNKGCTNHTDSFKVSVNNFNVAMRDTSLCAGDSILLAPGVSGATYVWQNGDSTNTYTVKTDGTYIVQVNLNGCIKKDTVQVAAKTISVNLGPDQTICDHDTLKLDTKEPNCNYLWQDNSTNQTFDVTQAGTYWVDVSLASCKASDTVNVSYEKCSCNFFAPTAFTPNNDTRNDIFEMRVDCNVTNFRLRIFNRWGQQVFTSTDVNGKWDGTFNGVPADVGVYSWEVKFDGPKNTYFEKGNVTLLR